MARTSSKKKRLTAKGGRKQRALAYRRSVTLRCKKGEIRLLHLSDRESAVPGIPQYVWSQCQSFTLSDNALAKRESSGVVRQEAFVVQRIRSVYQGEKGREEGDAIAYGRKGKPAQDGEEQVRVSRREGEGLGGKSRVGTRAKGPSLAEKPA